MKISVRVPCQYMVKFRKCLPSIKRLYMIVYIGPFLVCTKSYVDTCSIERSRSVTWIVLYMISRL